MHQSFFEKEIIEDNSEIPDYLITILKQYQVSYFSVYGAIQNMSTVIRPDLCNTMNILRVFF